jgi:competence protein ComFC
MDYGKVYPQKNSGISGAGEQENIWAKCRYFLPVLANEVFDFFFPREEGCVICGTPVNPRRSSEVYFALICHTCSSRLPFVKKPICRICGRPLRGKTSTACKDCTARGRFFVAARAVGVYEGVLRDLICELKFHGRRELAEGLGVLMAREVSKNKSMRTCDIIVPVPLHPIRLRERGYNQAECLGREISVCLGIPISDCMQRIIRPGEQNKLGRGLRKENIRGVFSVPYPIKIAGKRVLLTDDVITTGNTANECARILLRAGAIEVYMIAAAVSPFEQEWHMH